RRLEQSETSHRANRRLEHKEEIFVSNSKWAARAGVRKLAAQTAVAAAGALVGVATAQAQGGYPNKPVRFINPVAAGGNQDIVSRAIAEQVSKGLGQQVLVESRPGASAIVGTRSVKASAPDGYTYLTVSNTFARVPAIVLAAGYDPLKDFEPVSLMAEIPMVLSVNPSLPVKTTQELIALAKKRPGDLLYASAGRGSTGHVAAEMFSRAAGIELRHIPYKGNAPAIVDLIGGQVMIMFDQVSTSFPHIRAGKLRALGVTSKERSALFPDLPTIEEAGLKGFQDATFNGIVAPAGTPREMRERIRQEVAKAVAVPQVHSRFLERGIVLKASGSLEEFGAFLRKQVTEFAKLAKEAGIEPK
ncbi:MAG: Bug family tripartite tricarboxylate transporter substrate binding protein, partial [Burkholderiales bacterium]